MTKPNILIWEYVKDLLHVHDCVIVPGFGGFVCNREPARIDQVSHVITPPSRKVVFNQNLKTNDGLLAEFWSQKQSVSYSQALTVIEDCIESIIQTLQEKKQLSIDLFGSFRLNAEANYVFLPDKRNNYLTSSFGLSPIQAQPVVSRTIKIPKPKLQTSRFRKTPTNMKKRNVWPSVLVVVLVGLLSVNGYIFLSNHSISDLRFGGENNTMNIGSWFDSLFHQQSTQPVAVAESKPIIEDTNTFIPPPPDVIDAEETVALPTVTEEPKTAASEDLYASYYAFANHYSEARANIYVPQQPSDVNEANEPVAETEPIVENTTAKEETAVSAHAQGYYVIGGVFCKAHNAKRFLKKLKESGYQDAEMVDTQTAHCKRVSYKKFTNKREAESYCIQLKTAINPEAWILELN